MATVNATPDSFSDGGVHDKLSAAISYISSSISAGATIIDIGGYSTRPGAAFVSVGEEINRVVPIIRAMRNRNFLERMNHCIDVRVSEEILQQHIETILTTPISIDTFRWQVAEAAIEAGANCINDVHAFGGPDSWDDRLGEGTEKANDYTINMKAIARRYSVPVVLMHSRGDAGSNKDYTTFNYAADERGRGAVLEGVRVELGARVDLVTKGKGGVRRWLVIVDPGIGFSKSTEGNLELLRSAKEVVGYNNMIGNRWFFFLIILVPIQTKHSFTFSSSARQECIVGISSTHRTVQKVFPERDTRATTRWTPNSTPKS
jgi:dihydroneopterin aldolase/2-amino-4-hydroxy-6-hydroxymethyldihydropteridine diphosphokinase/dihydropteroate synthase